MSKDKGSPATQWHPLFAALLRPLMQDYYDVQTNVPVGDAPREADVLLLQRIGSASPPFRGLWRHLTTWNILEFKGPTVDARIRDLDLLVELGLGIDRRMNEERHRRREERVEPENVSFWYLAKSLGRRFLPDARHLLGSLDEVAAGLWRSQIMRHPVFLVSSERWPTEPDSVPLHLLFERPPEQERELARIIIERPRFLEWYRSILGVLHPDVWQEVKPMAGAKRKSMEPKPDWNFLVEDYGVDALVKAMGVRRVIETVGPERIIKEMGVDWFISKLPPAQLKKLKEHLK